MTPDDKIAVALLTAGTLLLIAVCSVNVWPFYLPPGVM